MKLRIAILVFGLIVISVGEVYGADWKLFDFNDYTLNYYDAQSVTRPSKNVVRVWIRRDFTEKGVIDWVGRLGKGYENLNNSIDLWEINCIEKMVRQLSGIAYDNKGRVINSYSSPSEWNFIPPESRGETLYKEICKYRRSQN